jgi:N-acetylglucosamine-6-phosphate deacetylase
MLGPTANDHPFVSAGLIDIQVNGFAGVEAGFTIERETFWIGP